MTKRLTPKQVEALRWIDGGSPFPPPAGMTLKSVHRQGLWTWAQDGIVRRVLTDAGRLALAEAEGRKP